MKVNETVFGGGEQQASQESLLEEVRPVGLQQQLTVSAGVCLGVLSRRHAN